MCVDGTNELLDRALEAEGQGRLCDKLGRTRTDHVHAKNFVVLLVEHNLDEALHLSGDLCPAKNAELERTGLDLVPTGLRLLLGQADASDLGIAVRASGNVVVIDWRRSLARDAFGQRDAFGRRQVRELRVPGLIEERQAQSLDMTVQDNSGDTARRRAHWGKNFLRLRFWRGFRGRQHGREDFARCSNRPVRCRL